MGLQQGQGIISYWKVMLLEQQILLKFWQSMVYHRTNELEEGCTPETPRESDCQNVDPKTATILPIPREPNTPEFRNIPEILEALII